MSHTVPLHSPQQVCADVRTVDLDADHDVSLRTWQALPVARRLQVVRALRCELAGMPQLLLEACRTPWRRDDGETLAAELLPLLDACRFLTRRGKRILAPRVFGWRGRPLWLAGVRSEVQRVPFGTVLVIAPGNYPLFLPGVQILQALVAGNRVLVKPAPGCRGPMDLLAGMLRNAGLPEGVLAILSEDPAVVAPLLATGKVQKVVFTGSRAKGLIVARQAAEAGIACDLELSGCDAMFVLPGADMRLVAQALFFGLTFNSSATCIAPRRVLVTREDHPALQQAILAVFADTPAVPVTAPALASLQSILSGAASEDLRPITGELTLPAASGPVAVMRPLVLDQVPCDSALASMDVFAPVAGVLVCEDVQAMHAQALRCPFKLGASIFGPRHDASLFARQVDAGSVVVNDLVVPTADPRLAFGGHGASGHGVTRGVEGLLAMTQTRVISVRRGRWRAHLDKPDDRQTRMLRALIALTHGPGWSDRWASLKALLPG